MNAEKSLKIFRVCRYRQKLKLPCERRGQRILLGHLWWPGSWGVMSKEGKAGTATATTAPQRQWWQWSELDLGFGSLNCNYTECTTSNCFDRIPNWLDTCIFSIHSNPPSRDLYNLYLQGIIWKIVLEAACVDCKGAAPSRTADHAAAGV